MNLLPRLLKPLLASARDLTPVALVVAVFRLLVLRRPVPDLAGLLARPDINRAPVVADGRVIGTVGYTDLVLKGLVGRH